LKFDNIMITRMRDGRLHVRLLDFGVAKLLSRDTNLTQGGQVAGTPGIIAPELVDGHKPTSLSDLYSIGVLLYTALTGEAPFKEQNDLALMRAHKLKALPNLDDLVGRVVPEQVISLACELLEKEPERRPSDARYVRDRLEVMAATMRDRYPDATTYHPPQASSLESPTPALLFDAHGTTGAEPEEFIRKVFKEPVVAPMTVVAALSFLLMILIVVIIYMVFQLINAGQVP
ncbi:MAG: protein kinase domain-containing protein, partial [Bradymonadaceae bacterium]